MGMGRQLPNRARLVEVVAGRIPSGARAGQWYSLTHWRVPEGFEDAGVEFVTMVGPEVNRCFRYSGCNVPDAARQVAEFKAHLAE